MLLTHVILSYGCFRKHYIKTKVTQSYNMEVASGEELFRRFHKIEYTVAIRRQEGRPTSRHAGRKASIYAHA